MTGCQLRKSLKAKTRKRNNCQCLPFFSQKCTMLNLPIDQSMSYAANVRNLECDMDSGMCVYHPGIRDNWNVIHFLHTVRKINGDKLKEQFLNQYFTSHFSPILTRCPSVLSWSGKHILHTLQWKKLFRPPIRQMPHPSQWYWSLSSSSNKLQIKHVNCKRKKNWSE